MSDSFFGTRNTVLFHSARMHGCGGGKKGQCAYGDILIATLSHFHNEIGPTLPNHFDHSSRSSWLKKDFGMNHKVSFPFFPISQILGEVKLSASFIVSLLPPYFSDRDKPGQK